MFCATCGADPATGAGTGVALEPATSDVSELMGVPIRTLVSMAVGAAIAALIVLSAGLPNWIVATLATLSHEMGHAICGWMLGHPSIPSFDGASGFRVGRIARPSGVL